MSGSRTTESRAVKPAAGCMTNGVISSRRPPAAGAPLRALPRNACSLYACAGRRSAEGDQGPGQIRLFEFNESDGGSPATALR
jgi:hypothetical protein